MNARSRKAALMILVILCLREYTYQVAWHCHCQIVESRRCWVTIFQVRWTCTLVYVSSLKRCVWTSCLASRVDVCKWRLGNNDIESLPVVTAKTPNDSQVHAKRSCADGIGT